MGRKAAESLHLSVQHGKHTQLQLCILMVHLSARNHLWQKQPLMFKISFSVGGMKNLFMMPFSISIFLLHSENRGRAYLHSAHCVWNKWTLELQGTFTDMQVHPQTPDLIPQTARLSAPFRTDFIIYFTLPTQASFYCCWFAQFWKMDFWWFCFWCINLFVLLAGWRNISKSESWEIYRTRREVLVLCAAPVLVQTSLP